MRKGEEPLLDEVAGAGAEMLPVLGPLFGVAAKRLAGKMREEHRRNASVALAAAERISGMSREDLAEALEKNPALMPLLTRLLYTAGMNGYDETLNAMGAALGDAVREPDRAGEAAVILAALANLGREHITVLRALEFEPAGKTRTWDVLVEQVGSSVPGRILGLCVAELDSAGLAARMSGFVGGGVVYDITDLGRIVLDLLRTMTSESTPGNGSATPSC